MISIKNMHDLNRNSSLLPKHALKDIYKRITDWVSSGGKFSDPYIKTQFKYAEMLLNRGTK